MPTHDPALPAIPIADLVRQFTPELLEIKDPELRSTTEAALHTLPYWFWFIPAALGGKNHPPDECGIGGLVHHTKKTVHMARNICRLWDLKKDPSDIRSRAIAALLLHDCLKYGPADSTFEQAWAGGRDWSPTHPVTCAAHAEKHGMPADIVEAIASHYGPFLSVPQSKWRKDMPMNLNMMVFLSDGLSATLFNRMPFQPEEIIGGTDAMDLDSLKDRLLNLDSYRVSAVRLSPLAYYVLREKGREEIQTKKGIKIECLKVHGHSTTILKTWDTVVHEDRLFDDSMLQDSLVGSF